MIVLFIRNKYLGIIKSFTLDMSHSSCSIRSHFDEHRMAVHELKARYAGTLAGSLWSIVNPLITILVYWFVFSVGLKVRPMGDVPFILFFSVGLVPWTTFSEALT